MELLTTVLVTGALTSAAYALMALGFSLVYGVGRTVNLAHGSYFMVAAYGTYAAQQAGLPLALAAAVGILAACVLGVIVDFVVISPMRDREITILIGTLAVALAVEAAIRIIFGVGNKRLAGFADGAHTVLGVNVVSARIIAAVVSVVLIAVVLWVIGSTSYGRTLRAVAQDEEAARLMGIRTDRLQLSIIVLGAALAGTAGVFVSPYQVLYPGMWLAPLITAFSVVILGGLDSIHGTLVAACILGFLDRLVAEALPDGGTKAPLVALALILVVLVTRPQGLKGKVLA